MHVITLYQYRLRVYLITKLVSPRETQKISFHLPFKHLQSLKRPSNHYQFVPLFSHSMIELYGTKAIDVSFII
jgi:hypothetical protein